MNDSTTTNPPERRVRPRDQTGRWQTALTAVAPNQVLVRGYPLDEMMGRLSFAEAVYLLLMGELPTPSIGKMLNAVLVSTIDHGVTPLSTQITRTVATSGASINACVAAGILGVGPHHGGEVELCMRFIDSGLSMMRSGRSLKEAAEALADVCVKEREVPPGFGHQFHRRDPRAARLFQMALELELEGEHVRLIRAVERALEARQSEFDKPLPVNVDGAIAAICADLGFAYELGNVVFLISRVAGLIAHAHEERTRQTPMRQIDLRDYEYDGAGERRFTDYRK
jgi:citrate synthase